MASKYQVSQNGKVFGNYPAKDAESAILKAYKKVGQYYDFDFSKPFDVKRNSDTYTTFVKEVL